MEKNIIYGIALVKLDNYKPPTKAKEEYQELLEEYKEAIKKEDDLLDIDLQGYEIAYLFKLSDNAMYEEFDVDVILYKEGTPKNTGGGYYYHTGNTEVQSPFNPDDIVAVADENGEVIN